MNGRHDRTTAVCVSLPWSGGLREVRLPTGSWHYFAAAPHFHGLYSSLELCCEGPWFRSIQDINVTSERISRFLEVGEILLSFRTGFNLQASVDLRWSLCWCHWCCLPSARSSRHWSPCRRLWTLCRDTQLNFASSSSSPAKKSMSSAKWRLVICLPPILSVPSWSTFDQH